MDIENYHEAITDLYAHIRESLLAKQISEDIADQVAIDTADSISKKWGGESIYIPKQDNRRVQHRNQQIREEFNGHNHSELCRRYNVSKQWLYKILKQQSPASRGRPRA